MISKNAGQTWSREPTAINLHDYPHDALGRAVPYGVYDVTTNRGLIGLGTSGDTPAFAVDTIFGWWHPKGEPPIPEPTTSYCWLTQVQQWVSDPRLE